MSDLNPDINIGTLTATINVFGHRVGLYSYQADFYAGAIVEDLKIQDSPLVIYFNPPVPVANLESVGTPQIEEAIADAVGHGH